MSAKPLSHRIWIALAMACLVLTGGRLWAGESPWYVAARLGEASAEARFGSRHAKQVDDEASSVAVDLGYQIHRYLAVEAGYQDLGSQAGWGSPCLQTDDACIERLATLGLCAVGFECTEVLVALDAEISGLSLALVPRLPLGDRLSLRGKVGLMAWDGDVSIRADFAPDESFSGEGLLLGVGLHYRFPTGLGVLLQHEELDLDAGTTSLGLSWGF